VIYSHAIIGFDVLEDKLKEEFMEFLMSVSMHHYQQNLFWYICNPHLDAVVAITRRSDEIVASSVIRRIRYSIINKSKYLIQNGPVYSDYDSLIEHLKMVTEHLSSDAIDVRISPSVDVDGQRSVCEHLSTLEYYKYVYPNGNYTSTIIIDLERSIASIEAGFSSSLRRQLKKAKQQGIQIKIINSDEGLLAILRQVSNFYSKRGIGMPGKDNLKCFIKKYALDNNLGVVLSANYHGEMVAGVIIVGCGDRAIFSYGYKSEDAGLRKLPLSHLLHYEAIVWAKENGYRLYDFGGYNVDDIKCGNNQFKLGFSRNIELFSENYIYTFHPILTKALDMGGKLKNIVKELQ